MATASSTATPVTALPASAATHPRGLYTLFFTEMWERMSFYGMRALLVLFMVDPVARGGLGMTDQVATSIYGLYVAGVYLAALPGGWIGDRLLGGQRAVWIGGLIIAAGHFMLALPRRETFFLGLLLVVVGTGLLKPNVSATVRALYPEGGARCDAGFTIFYMGINLGAAIGPLVCSALGKQFNWHYGFAAAGVGMVAGLVQFFFTRRHLGEAGLRPAQPEAARHRDWLGLGVAAAVGGTVAILGLLGVLPFDPVRLAKNTTLIIVGVALAYFAWVFLFARLESVEKKRMVVIVILFLSAAMFWAGYEQAGSSLNLFAERYTQRTWAAVNFTIPAGWFQSVPAVFVILLAPVVAALWLRLARRQLSPPLPVKFGCGLLFLAAGFLVIALGARHALRSGVVWPGWLITTYLLHVIGELFLSPVGLSSVTKLAPARLVGQMMGIWFLGASLGNLIAGLFAGEVTGDNTAAMPARFLQVVFTAGGTGLLLLLCARPIRRLMSGTE